jgi:hypothetical protein
MYYRVLLWIYSMTGRVADWHAANGTWTYNHVCALWGDKNVTRIYPPCDTSDFM